MTRRTIRAVLAALVLSVAGGGVSAHATATETYETYSPYKVLASTVPHKAVPSVGWNPIKASPTTAVVWYRLPV
jgi:hypothetical protein